MLKGLSTAVLLKVSMQSGKTKIYSRRSRKASRRNWAYPIWALVVYRRYPLFTIDINQSAVRKKSTNWECRWIFVPILIERYFTPMVNFTFILSPVEIRGRPGTLLINLLLLLYSLIVNIIDHLSRIHVACYSVLMSPQSILRVICAWSFACKREHFVD